MKQEIPNLASNSFVRTLGELRKGCAVTDASNELARVVQEVERVGKPGKLVVTLIIRPNADGETVGIEDSIDAKIPKATKKETNFFIGEDGQLLRNDPKQKELFGTVEGGAMDSASDERTQAVNQ